MYPPALVSRRFYGTVREGAHSWGTHFCEVQADPYAPRDMRVEIHWTAGQPAPDPRRLMASLPDRALTIEGPDVVVYASNPAFSSDRDGSRLRAVIDSIHERRTFGEAVPVRYKFGYRFPLTSLTSYAPLTTRHGEVGFLRGDANIGDGRVTVVPPPMIEVILDGVLIKVGSTLDFYTSVDVRYPMEHVVTESIVTFNLTPGPTSPQEEAKQLAETVLRFVSVVERDRIHWTREHFYAEGPDKEVLSTSKTLRWTSPPRNRARRREPCHHAKALRALVEAYDAAVPDTRANADLVCDQFEVAATAADVETSLVRWHSVVDFICKRAGFDDRSKYVGGRPTAAMRMVKVCDHLGVSIEGLVAPDTLEVVRDRLATGKHKKGKDDRFSFTRLRDDFVHEGFDSFDGLYGDVVEARASLRALAERLLAALLGAEISETHLGTVDDVT